MSDRPVKASQRRASRDVKRTPHGSKSKQATLARKAARTRKYTAQGRA